MSQERYLLVPNIPIDMHSFLFIRTSKVGAEAERSCLFVCFSI